VTGVKGFRAVRRHTVLRSRGYTNMRISRFFGAILMAGIAATAAAETVYKWVDSAGQVHYTDLPPSQSGAKLLGIYQQEAGVIEDGEGGEYSASDEGYDSDSLPDAYPPGEPATTEPPVSDEAMEASQADAERVKAEQCKEAQARYQRYIESRRLFRETPDGKREYLTDKELTEARARAKQTVTDYCS
jgi:hypothetical protein